MYMADPGRLRMLRAEQALAPITRLGCQSPDKRGSTIYQHGNQAAIRSASALGGLISASVALSSGLTRSSAVASSRARRRRGRKARWGRDIRAEARSNYG